MTEGEVTFVSGDGRSTGKAGSYTFLLRDIPHGFRITGDKPATFFLLFTPASFEQMFIEMGELTPPAGPPDMDKLMASVIKHNAEIWGRCQISWQGKRARKISGLMITWQSSVRFANGHTI